MSSTEVGKPKLVVVWGGPGCVGTDHGLPDRSGSHYGWMWVRAFVLYRKWWWRPALR